MENTENAMRPKVVGLKTGQIYDLCNDFKCASLVIVSEYKKNKLYNSKKAEKARACNSFLIFLMYHLVVVSIFYIRGTKNES